MFKLTKRNIAKGAMHVAVGAVSNQVIKIAVNTVIDSEDVSTQDTVNSASSMAATGVMMVTWGHTDRLVDRIAEWRIARKEAKNEPALQAVA